MATKKAKVLMPSKDAYCHGEGIFHPVSEMYYVGDERGRYEHFGFLPYCKTCCDMICDDMLKKTKSVESAIYFTCARNDIPFMREVYEATLNYMESTGVKNPKPFRYYMNQLTLAKKKKGFTARNFYDSDIELGEVKQLKKSEAALVKESQEFELVWGKQDVNDYQFLEYRWDIYTEDLALTPAQETLYRQLCLVELTKRKKEENSEGTKEEQGQILSLMKVLKIDNFAENKDKTLVEQMIETDIFMMEKYEPSEYYEDKTKYADFLNIGKDYKSILRSIKNLVTGSREYPDINDDVSKY